MRFPGIIPAAITPFRPDDTVDHDALAANLDALLAAGVHGVVVTGTMGESASLDLDERRAVVATAAAAIGGRVPLLAGIAAPTARIATRYAADARAAGATGLMVLPPLNYAGDARELIAFYTTLAEASGLPVMAYNNPGACGVEMTVAQITELATSVEGVVAIKECSGDARNVAAIVGATPDEFEVLVGGDDFALEGFATGATGWISGVANVIPGPCVELYERHRAGDPLAARSLYLRMLPLARLDMTPKLVQYFKAAMDQVGFTGGAVREPRLPLTAAEQLVLADAIAALEPAAVA